MCCIPLSPTRQVHVDEEQLAFLVGELRRAEERGRPVALFTHAPIMGSGLKASAAAASLFRTFPVTGSKSTLFCFCMSLRACRGVGAQGECGSCCPVLYPLTSTWPSLQHLALKCL